MSTTQRWLLVCLAAQPIMTAEVSPVCAQADSAIRIRVTTDVHKQQWLVGTLVSAGRDSVRLQSEEGGVVSVRSASIVRVEQSRGRRNEAGRGALLGTIIGGGTGFILGLVASTENESYVEIGPEEVVAATALFAVVGAGLGALIGFGSNREYWEPITLPTPDHPAEGPTGPRVWLAVRF
jgi:hypothetical protein